MTRGCLLLDVLAQPRAMATLSLRDWDLLVRQARHARLLGRLAAVAQSPQMEESIPAAVRDHFHSERVVEQEQARSVRREVRHIVEALSGIDMPVVLLKGAAYLIAGLPAAQGRIFHDIDVLVAKAALGRVEAALQTAGWASTHLDPYDQRYYRQWMHELPPLQHATRKSVLDVHHAILPETARLRSDAGKLLAAARPVDGNPQLRILAPVDMVLHSATHLFTGGEYENGLRDLTDLDALLRHFGQNPNFWAELVPRARELGLARPLYYALHHAGRLCQTPVPAVVMQASESDAPAAPLKQLMDDLFHRALVPDHTSCRRSGAVLARWLLYVRSHYLRMPLHLLVPHLLRKALWAESAN